MAKNGVRTTRKTATAAAKGMKSRNKLVRKLSAAALSNRRK